MSLYKTIMKYLKSIDIDGIDHNNGYNKIKNKYDDTKKKDTREL